MTGEPLSPKEGRGQRPIRKSPRAAQSDGPVPGITSAQNFTPARPPPMDLYSSLPQSPTTKDSASVRVLAMAGSDLDEMDQNTPAAAPAAPEKLRTKRTDRKKNATAAKPAVEPTGTYGQSRGTGLGKPGGIKKAPAQKRKPTTSKLAAGRPRKHLAQQITAGKPRIPPTDAAYSSDRLPIYFWERPEPKDFLQLSDSRKAWKARIDKEEEKADNDPELDEWSDFSFVPGAPPYPGYHGHIVACTFIRRAKRAFRRSECWEDFEEYEMSVDSTAHLRGIADERIREQEAELALSNQFRLEVWEAIKVRLCQEIWLEEYESLVKERADKDSSAESQQEMGFEALRLDSAITSDAAPTPTERMDTSDSPERANAAPSFPAPSTRISGILKARAEKSAAKEGSWAGVGEILGSALQTQADIMDLMEESDEGADEVGQGEDT